LAKLMGVVLAVSARDRGEKDVGWPTDRVGEGVDIGKVGWDVDGRSGAGHEGDHWVDISRGVVGRCWRGVVGSGRKVSGGRVSQGRSATSGGVGGVVGGSSPSGPSV
jgi:hypothetical protein